MPVQDVLRKIGQWSVQLGADAPPGVLGSLNFFGHIVIVPGRLNPVERGDELLALARYVGIFRDVETSTAGTTLSGVGLAAWLGDEDGKGDVIENPGVTVTSATFATAIRALLPAHGSITEGTLFSGVSGTISNTFTYQSPRSAIDYVADTMGGEWRVNGNFTLDAGPASSLFRTTPTCVIVRRDSAGYDQVLRALPGDITGTRSVKDYVTRAVIVAQALAGGTADAVTVPYVDGHGNPVKWTRVVDETDDTASANASARAQSFLNLWSGVRKAVRLSVDEFDVAGDFTAGDVVWVYDPASGFADTTYEVPFRGRLLNPVPVRVRALTWPVAEGYTVAFRNSATSWIDLTPYVAWESSSGGEVEVSDSLSTALTPGVGTIGTVVSGGGGGAGDTAVPDVPTFTTGSFTTTTYQPGDGLAKAAIKLVWTQPLNTDTSTIVDGDHYDLRWRKTGTTDWQVVTVPFDQTTYTLTNLPPSTGFDFQIRAVDYASPINYGAWSSTTTYTSATDTTAPGTPAAPTVAASLIAVQVTHTLGLASGGTYNLPLDMDHLEVHVGTGSGFTPSTGSLVGKLPVSPGMVTGSVPAVGTFPVDGIVTAGATAYVKVVAVDRTGNRSTASAAASATALLIDNAHISDLTVAKLTAGTMSAAVILSGSIKTGTSGARVEEDVNGIRLYNSGGSVVVNLDASTGNATFAGALSGATGSFAGSLTGNSISGATISGGTISGATITGTTLQTAASGARVLVGAGTGLGTVDFYDGSGNTGFIQASSVSGSNQIRIASGSGGGSRVDVYTGAVIANCGANGNLFVGNDNVSLSTSTAILSLGASSITLDPGGTTTLVGSSRLNGASDIGNAGDTTTLRAGTILLSNIGSSTGTTLVANSRSMKLLSSSLRFKTGIEDAVIDPTDVLALRPITYYDRWQVEENDGSTAGLPNYFGFIAEEIADGPLDRLVFRDENGDPFSLDYDRVTVLLLAVCKDLAARVAELEGTA